MIIRLDLTNAQRRKILSADEYDHTYESLCPVVPGLLSSLSQRFLLGVVANQTEGTERRLKAWSVRNHLSLIFSSAERGLSKPDPANFECALPQAGCAPKEAVTVGDRLDNDIGPARTQGWQTIRVLQGFSRFQQPRVPEEAPDVTAATNAELSGILIEQEQQAKR